VLAEEEEGVAGGRRGLSRRRGRRLASLVPGEEIQARGPGARVEPQPPVAVAGDLVDEGLRGRGLRAGEVAADQQRPDLVDQVVEGDRV
jgi:hypothetical protein